MILFNGTALEDVAPVKISDVVVSPVTWNPVARQRPIRIGSDFVRLSGQTRTVSITFALLTMERDTRSLQLGEITKWARTEQPAPLYIPHYGGYLNAICTAYPEPSLRQWWESKLRITFTAYDPCFVSIEEKTAACGTQFYVLGDAPPLMTITNTYSADASNQAWTDGTDTMTFTTVPAGDLVIDLNRQTAAVDGASIMQYYTFDSSFPEPRTGAMTITGTGTVHYRERWL